MSYNKQPLVVIFGRTNVGKSTLFNTLIEKEQAIVANAEGTTRDVNIAGVNWRGRTFSLVDTGGIIDHPEIRQRKKPNHDLNTQVLKQARDYLKRADFIIFLTEAPTGLLAADRELARYLKKTVPAATPLILAVNKVDGEKDRDLLPDFYRLGLGEPQPVSARTGSGTGDLLDLITTRLADQGEEKEAEGEIKPAIRVAIVGQPNVGKSSLVNAILGEDRVITSHEPHTTREPRDLDFSYRETDIKFVDTAGLSRRGRQKPRTKKDATVEKLGIGRSLAAIRKADIALLVIDVSQPLVQQDAAILSDIISHGCGLVIAANKWDLIPDKKTKEYTTYLKRWLSFAPWAPVCFLSAKNKAKIPALLNGLLAVRHARNKTLAIDDLKQFVGKATRNHLPPRDNRGHRPEIMSLEQDGTNPPQFRLKLRRHDRLPAAYIRYLENRLREKFNFIGTPIVIRVERHKKNKKITCSETRKNF